MSISYTVKAVTCLLFLVLAITCAASARILDEETPRTSQFAVEASDPVGESEAEIFPTAVVSGVATVVTPSITQGNANPAASISANIANTDQPVTTDLPQTVGTDLPTAPTVAPEASVVGPVAGVAPVTEPNATPAAAASATIVSTDPHPTLSFFMHNVLGGTHPTAVAVSAVAANPAANGQVPFSNPNGAILPVNNVIPLSGVGNTNRMVPTKPNSHMNAFGLPCLNSEQLPGGKTVQKPLFEKMTVIDDELTEGHELGSGLVGRAQGFYVMSSEDGSGQCVALTAMFENGSNADSINFIGVLRTQVSESQVGVMGGTGKYVNAEGYANVKTIPSGKHHDTDGLETMLEFTVYLA